MTNAELILEFFRGRADHLAIADDGCTFRPQPLTSSIQAEWLEADHVAQKRCYGFYLLDAESKVFCSCVDFDNKPNNPNLAWHEQAEQVYYALANLGMSPVVEISASGSAAHVWMFFDKPSEAWIVRAWWRALAKHLGTHFQEIYPRQDRLSGKGLGNLVRYPLWNQSHFVDVENDWKTIDPSEALANIKRVSEIDLKVLAFDIGCGELKPESPLNATADGSGLSARVEARLSKSYSLLARRWAGDMTGLHDASRSALVLSIATELVRTYVPTAEIEQAIRRWCELNDYDKGERDEWIGGTVSKAYEFVVGRNEKQSADASTMDQACHAYLDSLAKGIPQYVPTGIAEVDRSIDGIGFGEMAVIAARPSHGKSAFALHWLDTAAHSGMAALIISEEMAAIELGKRALLSISEVEEINWPEQLDAVRETVNAHYADRAPVYVVENCSTIDRCEEIIDQHCVIHGTKIVAVDYMQLLGGRADTRYEVVSEISRRLKQAARRNGCALLALSQLNRSIEGRDGQIPRLSDLRESGQIEQDADLILFLQWPLKIDGDQDPKRYIVFAAKRRNGPIRQHDIETEFDASRQRFGKQTVIQDFDHFEWAR